MSRASGLIDYKLECKGCFSFIVVCWNYGLIDYKLECKGGSGVFARDPDAV